MAELDPSEFSEVALKANGMPAHHADETVSRLDATMKDSLLRLVRSGIHTGAEWEPGPANVTSPSLVFWGRDDQYQPVEYADSLARNVRATNVVLLDSGHWPQLQQPRELAAALTRHWESAPA
jgi:pimeloyl-ACP methyl ester carboxylesterase